jgi:hypothetical protein
MVSNVSFWMVVTVAAVVCVVTHCHEEGGRLWTQVRDDDCELQAPVSLLAWFCT